MKNLRVWQKLTVLALVFLIPFATLTYQYVTEVNGVSLETIRAEQNGRIYIEALRDVLDHAARHNVLKQAQLRGDSSQDDALRFNESKLRAAMSSLDSVDEAIGEELGEARTKWVGVHKQADTLLDRSRNQSVADSLRDHNQLIADALDLLAHVGDKSQLVLDPQIDSYWMMSVVVFTAPETADLLGRVQALGIGIAASHRMTPEQSRELQRLCVLVANSHEGVLRALDKVAASTTSENARNTARELRDSISFETNKFVIYHLALANSGPQALAALQTTTYLGRTDKAISLWQGLQKKASTALRNMLDQRQKEKSRAMKLTLFAAIGGWLLTSLLAVWISRDITKPLHRSVTLANRIALGDLSQGGFSEGRADELGSLLSALNRMSESLSRKASVAQQIASGDLRSGNLAERAQPISEKDTLGIAFSAMVSNLQTMLSDVNEAVAVLSSSASQIVASTSQLSASAGETATAITETTATVEEVRQTAQLSSQKARIVADGAQHAADAAHSGRDATLSSTQGMTKIRAQMDSIAASMVRLSEQSQTIAAIISSVDDLTQHSNLLAVNAAIEAAKAGEHGKGFAVVAHEVKSLAEQARQSTLQVRAILGDIQKATGAAVMATEQGAKAVDAGVEQCTLAGESIERLSENVEQSALSATQIAASSQEQLIGMDQVALAMESIRQASQHNLESAHQLQSSAHGLSELGQRLREMVERYEV